MLKHGLEGVNLNNPIENKLPSVIEYFVKVYGEKYRERITTRLNDTIFVFVDQYFTNRIKDIENHFEELRFNLLSKFKQKSIINFSSLTKPQLDQLDVWQKNIDETEIENVKNFLKHFVAVDSYQLKTALQKGYEKDLCNFLADINDFYHKEVKKDLEYLDNEQEKFLALPLDDFSVNRIENSYNLDLTRMLYKNIVSQFAIPDNEGNESLLMPFLPAYHKAIKTNQEYFSSQERNLLLDFFKVVDKLSNDDFSDNKSFYDYLQDKNFKNKLFGREFKRNLNALQTEKEIKLTPILCDRIKNTQPLYDEEFVFQDDILQRISEFSNTPSIGQRSAAFIFPGLSYSDLEKTRNICVCGSFFNLYDSNIIHEMNHIIESDYSLKNAIFYQKTGFDINKTPLGRGAASSNNCLLLNETINDYLSLKVLKLMENDGFKIGHKTLINSTYSKAFPLIEDFIEENLNEIIDSRMSENPMSFAEKIGLDNFNALSKAVDTFLNLAKVYSIESASQELKEKTGQNEIDMFSIETNPNFSNATNLLINCFQNVKEIKERISSPQIDTENEI